MTTEDKGMELKAEFVAPGPYAYRLYDEEDGTWIVFSTDPKILIREHGEMLGPMDKETARYMALHMNIAHVEAWNRRHSDANKVLDELKGLAMMWAEHGEGRYKDAGRQVLDELSALRAEGEKK